MALNITPVTNHREREKGVVVYPVYSRRSSGLSIGINLFPDKKNCQFDCPYCEVFPFAGGAKFSLEQMETDLRSAIDTARKDNIPVKDICFSGNGEPTLSPAFAQAFALAEKIRRETLTASDDSLSSQLVVITNGAGLFQTEIFSLLKKACTSDTAQGIPSPDIWLKLDAGTPDWYHKINRCAIAHNKLIEKITDFTACAPVTIQTMLCAVDGKRPSEIETKTWVKIVCQIAENAVCIRKVQIYGKARPAPEDPYASSLPDEYLEERASSLRGAFENKSISIPVEVYY
ncbi:MAG: hypothetical protein FWB77_05235 [Treponema sp.]|nr:hypothetical protein [Treponema sp.]